MSPVLQIRPALRPRLLAPLALALLSAACATLDPEASRAPVAQAVERLAGAPLPPAVAPADAQDAARVRVQIDRQVDEWLREPLSMVAAVQISLWNHRGLAADLESLNVAEAERVMVLTLSNPGFTFGRSRSGDEREVERSLHVGLTRLLARPWLAELAQRDLARRQAEVTARALAHVHATRRAWIEAVAAQEQLHYMRQVMTAAEASAELARRMAQVGNFNRLAQAREQAFYADAALDAARAQQRVQATRERLVRHLGLWGDQTAFRLPERLPVLPTAPSEWPDIEREGLATRLDVVAERAEAERLARQIGLDRVTRWVPVLEYERASSTAWSGDEREREREKTRGWEIGFQLPIFDTGTARLARSEALYRQQAHRTAQTAIEARSELREAYGQYRHAWDIARHHWQERVPLRQRIAEENLLRYNGMLIGVFELLADARTQIASVSAALDALREFWLAEVDLQAARIGRPGLSLPAGSPASSGAAAAASGDPH
jgi:outer membrane protein TolC